MHAEAPPAPMDNATATLKRVRDTEVDLAARLAAVHAATESALAKLREDAEKAVRAAASEADRTREVSLIAARSRLETDATKIEADGRAEAERIEAARDLDVGRLKAAILKAVFGGFTEDAGN